MYQAELKQHVNQFLKDEMFECVLEIGCRSAEWLRFFSENINREVHYTGIDIDDTFFNMINYDTNKISLIVKDVNKESIDNKYDLIFIKDVMEYITDLDFFVQQIYNALNENGRILVVQNDYASVHYNSLNREITEQAMKDYAIDQSSGERADCDIMGRQVWGIFQGSGLFEGKITHYMELETEYIRNRSGYLLYNQICELYEKKGKLINQIYYANA